MHRLFTGPLTQENITIPIKDLPTSLEGMVIAQLSDFHYDGLRLSNTMLDQAIGQVQDLNPDLIALTGDFVTQDPTPIYPLAKRLQQMPSRYGTFAVLGNHDIKVSGAQEIITQALEQADISVLSHDVVMPTGADLALIGFPFYGHKNCCFDPHPVFHSLDPALPRIVLAHSPDAASSLRPWRVDLQLSGHSHGGQILIPRLGTAPQVWNRVRRFIPAGWRKGIPYLSDECMKVVHNWDWAMGLHQVGDNLLYINRGLGTYLPGRFRCPPELTVITLTQPS